MTVCAHWPQLLSVVHSTLKEQQLEHTILCTPSIYLIFIVILPSSMNYEHLISDLIFQHLLEFPHKNGELWLYEKFHKSIIFKSSLGNGIKIRSLTIINLYSMYICYKDKSCSLEITEITGRSYLPEMAKIKR